jgi:diacylglycerol kinase family enzyme
MPLLVLYNPICGDKTAKSFVEGHVLPLLRHHSKQVDHVVETTSVGHAAVAVTEFCAANLDALITVLVASGDGTLHEIINARTLPKIHFVLVPCGTANALYSSLFPPPIDKVNYRLQSLLSYIEGGATLPLSMAVTVMSAPADKAQPDVIAVAAVVVSTSLHASILRDSECLREEYPGVQRYV